MGYIYAKYTENLHPKMRGNSYIEALPTRKSPEEFWVATAKEVLIPDSLDGCDPETIEEYARDISEGIIPTSLFYEVYCDCLGILKNGLKGRNPLSESTRAWQHQVATSNLARVRTTAPSLIFTGFSGMGKTTLIDSVFSLIPSVILHPADGPLGFESKQIVYIKVNIPGDADLKQICLSIIGEIDKVAGTSIKEEFEKKGRTTNDCISKLTTLCTTHLVGMIIFDEIQNICLATPNARKLVFTLFDKLSNEALVPTVKIGTTKANSLIKGDFTSQRRLGIPHDWSNYRKDDQDWEMLLEYAWEYQLLPEKVELTNEYKNLIYDYTQGIVYCLFYLMEQANITAVRNRLKKFSKKLLEEVYNKKFRHIRPAIIALKSGNAEAYDDLYSLSNKLDSDLNKQVKALLKIADKHKLKGEAAKSIFDEIKLILPDYKLTTAEAYTVKRLQKESGLIISSMETEEGEFEVPI